MTTTAPFQKFRIYAGKHNGHGLYVTVRVFPTKTAMLRQLRAEARKTGESGVQNAVDGVMQGMTRHLANRHTTPSLGLLNLYRARLGTEVVVHEFAHAAFAWAARKRLTGGFKRMAVEEQFCYALGRMVSRFVRRAVKLGLYEE